MDSTMHVPHLWSLKSTHLKLVRRLLLPPPQLRQASPDVLCKALVLIPLAFLLHFPQPRHGREKNCWTKCGAVSYHALLSPSGNYGLLLLLDAGCLKLFSFTTPHKPTFRRFPSYWNCGLCPLECSGHTRFDTGQQRELNAMDFSLLISGA